MPKRQKLKSQQSESLEKNHPRTRHSMFTGEQFDLEMSKIKHMSLQGRAKASSRGKSKQSAKKDPRRKRKQREQKPQTQQQIQDSLDQQNNQDHFEGKSPTKSVKRPKIIKENKRSVRILPKIMQLLDYQEVPSQDLIVPHCPYYQLNLNELIGKTSIFQGTSRVGKRCAAYYIINLQNEKAIEQIDGKKTKKAKLTQLIEINMNVYMTEVQFIKKLTTQLGGTFETQIDKRTAMTQDINLNKLNILFKKKKDCKVIILIRYAERLLTFKKQTVLYSLMEWVKTEIRDQVGIIFSTYTFNLVDKFEKRVKSRFNGKIYHFFHPKIKDIFTIIQKRLQKGLPAIDELDSKKKQKILQAVNKKNKLMFKQVQYYFNHLPRGIDYYLKAFRLSFGLYSENQFAQIEPNELLCDLPAKFLQSLQYIPPLLSQHNPMIQTCSVPQVVFLAVMRNMIVNERYPLTLTTIWEHYNEYRNRYLLATLHQKSIDVSFDEIIGQKIIKKLKDVGLISVHDLKDNIWSMQISIRVTVETIFASIKNIKNLPYFVNQILDN